MANNKKVELIPSRVQVGIHVATVYECKTDSMINDEDNIK